MRQVETTNSIRFTIAGCFATRLAVIGVLIVHMTTLSKMTDYTDVSWSFTIPAIWFQVVMNVSVLTACIPGAQHILSELRTGLLTINVQSDNHDPNRYGSVFGTNSENLRTRIGKGDKIWEMARMNSGSGGRSEVRNQENDADSERWLTGKAINVTKEVNQAEEYMPKSQRKLS